MNGTPSHQRLTDRQERIVRMVARGHTNTEIAEELGISLNGVKWHVRELFAKYGVDTREELAEAWQESRRPANRVRGWVRGLGFGVPMKVTAGGAAAAATLGIAAGSLLALVNTESPPAVAGKKELPTATPPATPTPQIVAPAFTLLAPQATNSPVAISDADYRVLLDEMRQVLSKSGLGQESTRGVYTIHDLELEAAEYAGSVEGPFELGDDDHYLPARDGAPRELFRLRWRVRDVPVLTRPGNADFVLTALFENGHPERVWWHYRFGSSYDATLNSRNLERILAEVPSNLTLGEPVHIGYRDNDAGDSRRLEGTLREDGILCVFQVRDSLRAQFCGFDGLAGPLEVLHPSTVFSPAGVPIDRGVVIIAAPEITSIEVTSGSLGSRIFETQPMPDELPLDVRMAYITVPTGMDALTVIGYNAAGEEVGRATSWP